MKRNRIAFSVLAFIAMLMVLAAPATATENLLYFNPDNSSVPGYCNSVDVQIMANVNESNPVSATAMNITFDPSCVDITNWVGDTSVWAGGTTSTIAWSIPQGFIRITTAGVATPDNGSVPIGILTLHCNDTGGCCGSWLNFVESDYTSGVSTIYPATDDGTFLCGDGINVTKTIWDESSSSWVDALGPLPSSWMGQEVTFNITVTAGCMSLSNLMIVDTMSDSLAYVVNSSIMDPDPSPYSAEPTLMGPPGSNQYMWFIPYGAGPPPLPPGGTLSITFNATIVAYGTDCNVAVASAGVTDLGLVKVSAMDQACVTTMPPAGIDVNKTVWNPVIGQWVDVLAMQVIDELDIGDPASEAGHALDGWGPVEPATSGGNYGSVANPPEDGTCRGTWYSVTGAGADESIPATLPDPNERMADFTMNNPGHAKQLQLRILDGLSDDSFDVFINGIEVYSYAWSGNTAEFWVTHEIMVPISERNVNSLAITINSTGPQGSHWDPYGQLAVQWAKLYTWPQIGDTYRFRCEMENSGSPGMDLTNIIALDILSDSLEYADNARIQTPNGVWRDINPPDINDPANNTVGWTIDSFLQDPLTLQPGQIVVIEFNATVVDYGYDCNEQIAEAWCEAALSAVEGSDTACIDTPEPDLTVTDITVNYDASGVKNYAMGPLPPGTKTQSNNLSADITEINGVDITASFDVTFKIDGGLVHTVSVPGLAAGATTTVYCDNEFFPIAGVEYTITVTADSVGVIPETDDGNNDMDKTLTAQVNGYKGDGWQNGRNISALQYHEGTVNLVYSTGDSYKFSGGSNKNWTTYITNWVPSNFSIPVTDSCIKKARLYVYYNYDKEPNGDPTNDSDGYYFNLTFNGVEPEVDQHYSDRKSFGSYDYPYGMIAYDVADRFMVPTDNHAELTYTWPTDQYKDISMTGMLLVVVYNNTETEPERIIWINEGFDSLYARDYYAVSSEEATTYAEFEGCEPIPIAEVVGANLVTVAPHGNEGGEKNKLTFNDGEWYGVWDSYTGTTELGINEKNVRTHLKATDNMASFQSHKSGIHQSEPYPYKPDRGDSMEASNAFLIVTTAKGQVEVIAPDECIGVTEQFDVMVNVTSVVPVYGVEYELSFNPAVIHAEWQNEGDFLKQGGANTNVYINTIDNSAGTVTFAVTRKDTLTGATVPGTLATVHFTAVQMGANTTLTLTSLKVSDPDAQPLPFEKLPDNVSVCDNVPPVAVPECLNLYNNVGTKYMSKTYFDGSASTDDGNITNYRWYFGDGNYGAGMTYEHIYGSWNWNGASYDQFEVILTVEDDGTPMMDNSTKILVNVYIAGDANGDGEVDIFDATIVGLEWGKETTDYWATNERGDKADLNNDGEVDIFDAVIIGANWGHLA